MKWLNYHHLYYFMTVAQTGSIAKASEILLLGQPAISAQIKQLEENLGTQLFNRKNRKLILTDAGKVALEYAEKIFQTGEELIQVFNNKTFHHKEKIKLGALDVVPKDFLIQLIEFINERGKNQVTIFEGSITELKLGLEKHELDIIISNEPIRDLNGQKVRSKNIFSDKVGIYGADRFAKLKKDFPASIKGQPFVLPTNHSAFRYSIDHYFNEKNLEYELVAETQDSSLKKKLGENGKGLIFLCDKIGKGFVKTGALVKLGRAEGLIEEYWLNYTERLIQSNIVGDIIKNFQIKT